ncbi:hypothetical protein ACFOSC_00960 [Streptantibioticus rubrisoli]|uniref:hypothetical protein n=1 Tax=Streptantibioticus rubrisoli TaxID=1387313 RepID=UPI0027E35332|nr:hypothetical protein [Streptantibioticus rubrisoli]
MGGWRLATEAALGALDGTHTPEVLIDAVWLAEHTSTFGHVIVGEVQELSPMTCRLLVRRCPTNP